MSIGKRPNVIQDVMTAFEYGNLIPTAHAQEQMDKRDVQMSDIEEMINNAHREEGKDSLRKAYFQPLLSLRKLSFPSSL